MTTAKVQILPLRRAYAPGKSKPCKDKSPKSAKSSGNDSSDSNDAHVTTAKRARASKPKVRSGCSTCKIRRIKCDETKPACVKCTSTGRTCDGYPSPPPRKNRASASVDQWPEPTRGLAMFPVVATPSEIRALEYFCLKTAPNLGMHFDADFWNRVVIPASVAEPALRHAMVAVGIFAEQRELIDIQNLALGATAERSAPIPSLPLQRTQDRSDLVALSNYNKSIGLLTKLVSSSAETVDLILLACILFVCVELLRGDEVAAIRHFTGGMTILVDNLSNSQGSSSSRLMMNRVKNSIMPAFNRLEMLYALFGNSASWQYSVRLPASVPDTFASVGQARDSMVHLMNLSLRFIQSIEFLEYEPFAIPASAYDAQAALLTHLQLWQTRFTAYKSRCTTTMTPDDAYAANVLEIQRIVAYTWLSTSMTAFQCAHDVHIPNYKTAVILAEQLSKIASMRTKIVGKAVTFLLDVEIVGPLYYVCVKCREPTVRRRAIAVMRGLSRREGIWDSRILAAIAERVVAVEEVDMVDGGLPSEHARIHNIPFANETNFSPEGYLTTWYRKPSGVYGDWSRWEEHVKLDARPAHPLTTDLLA